MVVLDIEVFKYDLLLGMKDLTTGEYSFIWGEEKERIKSILDRLHKEQIPIITFNGNHYDLPLLYQYFYNLRNTQSPFNLSKLIVEEGFKLSLPNDHFNSWDLFAIIQNPISLKVVEAIIGMEIRVTPIDFTHPYKLTDDERKLIEHYSIQDLDATEAFYNKLKGYMGLRLKLAEYLGVEHRFSIPLPTLMGIGLGAHRQPQRPLTTHPLCVEVPIENEVKNIMLAQIESPKRKFSYTFELGGLEYTVGNGGIHSTRKYVSERNVFHVDVKGYYTLLQKNFNLFSRNLPEDGVNKMLQMYEDRLAMKDSDPELSVGLKIGILSQWGATKNPHHILFDRRVGESIPLYGQLFIIYLIEMMAAAKIDVLNANTDGIIVKGDETVIREVVERWVNYGNFDVEVVHYERFIAKDINNYILGNSEDDMDVKGQDFTAIRSDWLFGNIVLVPQARVVSKILSELLYQDETNVDFDPERYVDARLHSTDFNLSDFLYIVHHTGKYSGMAFLETGEQVQRVNRVYASTNGHTLYKYRGELLHDELIPVRVEYVDQTTGRKRSISSYIMKSHKELFNNTFDIDEKRRLLVDLSEDANGHKHHTRLADLQYKYPGLPLVKLCNASLGEVSMSDIEDIDYGYYRDEILRKYLTYFSG